MEPAAKVPEVKQVSLTPTKLGITAKYDDVFQAHTCLKEKEKASTEHPPKVEPGTYMRAQRSQGSCPGPMLQHRAASRKDMSLMTQTGPTRVRITKASPPCDTRSCSQALDTAVPHCAKPLLAADESCRATFLIRKHHCCVRITCTDPGMCVMRGQGLTNHS
jgi:hypothetical protein